MTYQISVYANEKETLWHPWWHNFIDRMTNEGWDFDDAENVNLNAALRQFNAGDEAFISGDELSPYIIFDTEQDYLMFLLKFS